ncbi:MAG: hypothetical protein ACOCXM_06090 [Myxococcota bacterium]
MRYFAFSLKGLALAFGLLLTACGGPSEYAIVGTARAPSADGTATVEQIEGGNSLVTVQMEHLPPPDRLGEGLKMYMVWFEDSNQPAVRAGGLGFDEDKREGSMMATTPLNKFVVKVTAEKSLNVSTPSEVVVAKRKVSQ